MPSHHSRDAPRSPVKAMHRSRHTTRRVGEHDGKPFVEVVETTEEVTRTRPSPRARTAAAPQHEESDDYPRLAYHGNDNAARRNQSSARSTPRAGMPVTGSSSRYASVTNRGQTPRGAAHAAATPRDSQPPSSTRRRGSGSGDYGKGQPRRASGLVESPADITALDDYDTPTRRRRSDGQYVYDYASGYNAGASQLGKGRRSRNAAASRATARPRPGAAATADGAYVDVEVEDDEAVPSGPFHFRVRIHDCRGLFDDLRDSHRAAPAVYFALHTAEKRGHTGVTEAGTFDPVFNDEFMFTSADPEHDALVCTLVATATWSHRREKKVAECVLALHNVAWQVERMVWVPLVRHPGTKDAYEQGEVRVSIYSEDFGYDVTAAAEAEEACSAVVHNALLRYAPEELHRLDWLTAANVDKGPEAWAQLRDAYRARTVQPVSVKLTVVRVEGLMDDVGRPVSACDVHAVVSDGYTERQSKTVAYGHRASFNQDFHLTLANPEVDTMSVAVYGRGRKLGEAVAGLTNMQAGVAKEVTLMLVRAAETGDASSSGQVVLTLQAENYSSPYQMSAAQEARLRTRVRNYLWCYLRDDLHRLDAIVGSIDDEDVYMQEWARTIGPERTPRLLTVNVREATNIGAASNGMAPRCYVRVNVGPETLRTELAVARNGAVAFTSPLQIHVYDPPRDAVEVMLVADGDDGERELSRVCFGVANLPQGRRVVRSLHLVADAMKRTARVQGELSVELVAEDFGKTGADADGALTRVFSSSSPHVQRLEGIMQRSAPERLHRVPYMLDTAPAGEVERVAEEEAKQHPSDVAVAPMTVKILGVRAFKPATDFYVKVYLNNESILRTSDVKGAAEVALSIDDNNERTVRLGNAAQSMLTFKVARHRALLKAVVLGEAEVALSTLVRGEKNTLWLPFFNSSDTAAGSPAKKSASCAAGNPDKSVKVKGNRMPQAANGAAAQQESDAAVGGRTGGGTSPVGFLGVELQSMAFPNTTVTEYVIKDETGKKSVPALAVVTSDVTSLVAKMRPADLPKVQPMIAQCSSLKDAHGELRAQLSPVPIAGTVYVQVQSVELSSPEGQAQERAGGIHVEATFGSEHQVSRPRSDGAAGASSHTRYSQMRLDIAESVLGTGSAVRGKEAAGADGMGIAALELRLVGVPVRDTAGKVAANGAGASSGAELPGGYEVADTSSNATADSYYVGGENNINSYVKPANEHSHHRRWSIKQPSEERGGRPSKMLISQQQQQQETQRRSGSASPAGNESTAMTVPKRTWRRGSAFHNATYYPSSGPAGQSQQHQQQQHNSGEGTDMGSNKRYLGGVNNLRSYVDSPTHSQTRNGSPAQQDHRIQAESNNDKVHANHQSSSSRNNRATSPSPVPGTAAGAAAPLRGQLGLVRLSLRALLTTPLYKLGDTVRVPIVAPSLRESLSYRAQHSPEVNQRCIIGHVTLRLALPAFERVPESLRLGSRHTMSNVVPNYVHYYERRIGAYLRTTNAPDLVFFHYNLYERDVATGSWPVSLYDWMQSLIKRYGPETTDFGPEPPLPFDPEEWERARLRDEALRREREAAFAPSERSDAHGGSEAGLYSPRMESSAEVSQPRTATSAPRRSKEAASRTPAEPTYGF